MDAFPELLKEAARQLPRKSTAAVTLASALLLAVLAACGGQPGKPAAAPSPPASTSTTAPSPASTPSSPGAGTPSPAPSAQVLSSRLAYPWHWPNDVATPGRVTHANAVPPVPELVQISVGNHPSDPRQRPFNRMSFTFTTTFPSYRFEFTDKLIGDASGKVIPLKGLGVLKIVFT
jgi:hypothetical protein